MNVLNDRIGYLCLAGFALVTVACGGTEFDFTSNGHTQLIARGHSALRSEASIRTVEVCGDYPVVNGASDTGGSVCVQLVIDSAALATTSFPLAIAISGQATSAVDQVSGQQTSNFVSDNGPSPIITSLWLHFDCFCPNYVTETFHGSVTLSAVEVGRVDGSMDLTISGSTSATTPAVSQTVHAHFDAH